jgi:hypothetical protein
MEVTSDHWAEYARQYRKNLLPLVPSSGLFLKRGPYGDPERFTVAFKATWRRLSRKVRRTLREYWATPLGVYDELFPFAKRPGIEIVPHLNGSNRDALGMCMAHRHWFYFWAPAVDLLPEDLLQTLIAHELAHAHYAATGQHEAAGADPDDDEWEEIWVRECVQDWRFDEGGLDDWCEANLQALFAYAAERWPDHPGFVARTPENTEILFCAE